MTRPLSLSPLGLFFLEDGSYFQGTSVDDLDIEVPHLVDQVISYGLPKGDTIYVKVVFTSHCWTRTLDTAHDQDRLIVYDHKKSRVFCPIRYGASLTLVDMLRGLAGHIIFVASYRNYGMYNATVKTGNADSYTAFFTIKRERGMLSGQRFKYILRVESAYFLPQVSKINKISLAGIIASLK